MIEHHYCACGYAAPSAGGLIDHLHAAFSLADDIAPDGRQHAEAATDEAGSGDDPVIRCLCGYPAISLDDLDRHILAAYTPAYTPADATTADSARHVPASLEQPGLADDPGDLAGADRPPAVCHKTRLVIGAGTRRGRRVLPYRIRGSGWSGRRP